MIIWMDLGATDDQIRGVLAELVRQGFTGEQQTSTAGVVWISVADFNVTPPPNYAQFRAIPGVRLVLEVPLQYVAPAKGAVAALTPA